MKAVTITVGGPPGSGKTGVLHLIKQALDAAEVPCVVVDSAVEREINDARRMRTVQRRLPEPVLLFEHVTHPAKRLPMAAKGKVQAARLARVETVTKRSIRG